MFGNSVTCRAAQGLIRSGLGKAPFSSAAVRLNEQLKVSEGVWSNFEKRSEDLKIFNPVLRDEIINGVNPKEGPITVKRPINKYAYTSPNGLNEVFPLAYNLLQEHAAKVYEKIAKLDEEIANSQDELVLQNLNKTKRALVIEAEKHNPEVLYKVQFANPENLNLGETIYQHYYKTRNFEGYNKMLLMQRVEQMKVIPDSIPTINPEVELDIKFINESGVNRKITPGDILSSKTTAKSPIFQVKSFQDLNPNDKHTLLVVNLDEPDLERNSFSITLNYALKDIKLTSNNQFLRFDAENSNGAEFVEYLPPVPEKNAPVNRFVVLLFKQPSDLQSLESFDQQDFDLRKFVSINNLSPIGINFWRSTWDNNVKNVRKAYGLPDGRVFHRVRR